jgi:magnesium transporter
MQGEEMLVNCVLYRDGRKVRDIPIDEIGSWVGRGDSFVWVALKEATEQELETAQAQFNLHELAMEDAHHGHQRPKIEEYGDSLFAVLQLPEAAGDDFEIGEIHIFVGRDYVLSVRNHSEHGFASVRQRVEAEPELLRSGGSSFVFYALMDAVVDRYFPIIAALETELEAIEAQIFKEGAARSNIERLYDLKGRVMTLRHAVVPLMESVGKLFGGRVPALCMQTQDYFRDVYDHLYRVNASLDAIRETVATAIQVNLSMVTIQQSEVAKQLTGWAAIFAVATTIVGIWGMNFEFMPELKWQYGYPVALGMIGGVCGFLYYRFRKAGWL